MRLYKDFPLTRNIGRNSTRETASTVCLSPLITNVFEPVRPAVFLVQPRLTIGESPLHTPLALCTIRTIEERYVLVADILEPMYFAFILKQS